MPFPRWEILSHHSRGRSASPNTVPPILTPLRAWLRKRVSERIYQGGSILSKGPRQRLLTADLLPADERIDRHGDSAVDVLRSAVFGQTHLAEGFADAHDGFQMTHLTVHTPYQQPIVTREESRWYSQ